MTLMRIVAAALFVACLAGGVAEAKSPATKLVLTGPGLPHPVTITDKASTEQFNPWAREFIDWQRGLATDHPPLNEAYVLSIFVSETSGSPAYTVYYAPRADGSGLLYFPGRDELYYRANIGTIMGASSSDRWNPEGKWQYATGRADQALRGAIPPQAVSGPAASGASVGSPVAWGFAALIMIVAVGFIVRLTARGQILGRAQRAAGQEGMRDAIADRTS